MGEGRERWREGARGGEAGRENFGASWCLFPPLSLGFAFRIQRQTTHRASSSTAIVVTTLKVLRCPRAPLPVDSARHDTTTSEGEATTMSQVPPPAPPYGTAPTPGYQTPGAGGPPTSGKAIGSLITGILSLGLCCVPLLSIPLGIVAVVLGFMAKGDADAGRAGGRGLALAGLITGGIGAGLSLILWIAASVGGPKLGDFIK